MHMKISACRLKFAEEAAAGQEANDEAMLTEIDQPLAPAVARFEVFCCQGL
jgi:hypothetical protein